MKSQNLVDRDGLDDPEKPTILTRTRKWIITMATLTFTLTFASSVFTVAVVAVTAFLFQVHLEKIVLGTAFFIPGIYLSPIIWG